MPDTITIEIRRPDRDPKRFKIEPGVYTIGSDEDCSINISHQEVEGRHAILTIRDGQYWIEDLDSPAGTRVGKNTIRGRKEVSAGDEIGIGPFVIIIQPANITPKPETPVAKAKTLAPELSKQKKDVSGSSPALSARTIDPKVEQQRAVKQQIHKELVERLDIKRLSTAKIDKAELSKKAHEVIQSIVDDVKSRLPDGMDPDRLVKEICDEALGLGPLEDLIDDPEVTEVMVNGPNHVFVEKRGKLFLTDKTFMDETSVLAIIERIVSPIGRRIDESQPYVDARLPDGSRVNAIIHPLSLVGPCLTIRKFSKIPFTDEDFIKFGTISPEIRDFAKICVLMRKNIVVSGGTGSGKTSLLNVLSSFLPESDRIVTIEDAAELRLKQVHVVRLESRPPNIEGKGAITIRDLVRNSLRMRPDRIVVGECRGGEALDMLQAMNTGHDGSLTTVHANTPRDVISRLETMVLMSGMELPVRAIREQITSAIDLIIQESRFSDGTRKVTKVTEVVGLEGDQVTMQDIFEFVQSGVDDKGKVIGTFKPTGSVPTFIEEIESRGLKFDRTVFDPMKRKC